MTSLKTDDQVKIGDTAYEDGLFVKAANAYAKAWELKPSEAAIGMKAALIYVEKLDDEVSAAPMVFGLQMSGGGAQFADAIKALAERIGPAVKLAYDAKLSSGKASFAQGKYDDAANDFTTAAKMQPMLLAARVQVARVQAKRGDVAGTKKSIGSMLCDQKVKVEQIFSAEAPELIDLLNDAAFAEYITDALGEGAVAWAKANKPRAPKTNPTDGAEMLWVPAGEFIRGTSAEDITKIRAAGIEPKDEWMAREQPQNRIFLDGFWIYKTEVTVAQYLKFCNDTGRAKPKEPKGGWQDNYPIMNVSWHDAKAYADWAGVRLPTEAEWEKAARGTDGRVFPWGDDWSPGKLRCSRAEGGEGSPTTVGSYPQGASPYGALDMAGNVWEWCADWYDANYYAASPGRNPRGATTGELRVLRGGSWGLNVPYYFRASYRFYSTPDFFGIGLGFRCSQGP